MPEGCEGMMDCAEGTSAWTRWILQTVASDGSVPDPHIRRSLSFQYQHAAIVLGQAVREGTLFPSAFILRVLTHFGAIPSSAKRVSSEFSGFLLTLAWLYLTEHSEGRRAPVELQKAMRDLPIRSPQELGRHNNNLAAMAFFVLDAWRRRGLSVREQDVSLLRAQFQGFQSDDGFFYDTTCQAGSGIPSLVYHAKMTAVALLQGVLNDDQEFFERGKRGIDALLELCPIEHSMAYGRSQNSIFGFANCYVALRILARTSSTTRYAQELRKTSSLIRGLENASGEYGINLGNDNARRSGFDGYMYSIVYNAYAWSMLLLADALALGKRPGANEANQWSESARDGVKYLGESGFASVQKHRYGLYLNIATRSSAPLPRCRHYQTDPRYEPAVATVIYSQDGVLVPSIPATPRQMPSFLLFSEGPGTKLGWYAFKLSEKLRTLCFPYRCGFAGTLPFFVGRWHRTVAVGPLVVERRKDSVQAEFQLQLLCRLLRRRFLDARAEARSVGSMRYTVCFDETGTDSCVQVRLERLPWGRFYHLNLRLPAADFEKASQMGWWHSPDAGIRWKHDPMPSRVEWDRRAGSDAPVLYARAWTVCQGTLELEMCTRIEFPERRRDHEMA
jgi:hypothetical protein